MALLKDTRLEIQELIVQVKSLCEEFTHKKYLEGFTDMRKLFVLIYQIKSLDFPNVKSNLDFLTICINNKFTDTEFYEKVSFPFGSVEEAMTDLNKNNSWSILGKTRFCVCWEKNSEEYHIFGTAYSGKLQPNKVYYKTTKNIQTLTPGYSYDVSCFLEK